MNSRAILIEQIAESRFARAGKPVTAGRKQVHNFARATIQKRGVYLRALAAWCLERDLVRPELITKGMLESYQRWLYRYRKANGQPLAWSGQHLQPKEVRAFFA